MRCVAVLPWVVPEWRDDCIATCALDVVEIDNSVKNRGVPRSWNIGIDIMRERDADWLIVMSAALRFGDPGGLDFLEVLEDHPDHLGISALDTFGWHLMAFNREAIEACGRFDENFWPGYYEDVDYSIRMYRYKPNAPHGAYAIDVVDLKMGHTFEARDDIREELNNQRSLRYFEAKWGVPHGSEWHDYYATPFNGDFPLGYWPWSHDTQGCHDETIPEVQR